MTNNIKIGNLGEDIACRFLKKKGFKIVDRNYRKKWGEIDIIAQSFNNSFSAQFGINHAKKRNKSGILTKISSVFPSKSGGVLHFVEVKAVSMPSDLSDENRIKRIETFNTKDDVTRETVTRETVINDYNSPVEESDDSQGAGNVDDLSRRKSRNSNDVWYQPEDNIHPRKQNRLRKAIQSYLLQPRIPVDINWQFDIIALWIDVNRKKARIKFVEDIVL